MTEFWVYQQNNDLGRSGFLDQLYIRIQLCPAIEKNVISSALELFIYYYQFRMNAPAISIQKHATDILCQVQERLRSTLRLEAGDI